MVECREAVQADLDSLVALLREGQSNSQFADIPVDDYRAIPNIEAFLKEPSVLCLVLADGDEIVGALLAQIIPLWWAYGDAAQDVFFYVKPDYRGRGIRLMRAYRRWAKAFESVIYIHYGISFGGPEAEKTAQLYRALGFSEAGHDFIERI